MKVSFFQLWDNMSLKEDVETPAMRAIKAGFNIEDNFWDNFIAICNNTDALADLLDVSPEQIIGWSNKIKSTIDLVDKHKSSDDVKTKLIDTGEISEE